MLLKFIRLCLIFILIGGGVLLFNQQMVKDRIGPYIGMFTQTQEAVKGISTNKSEEITNQFKKEVDSGINQVQKQVLNTKLSDIYDFFNKGQKISGDFRGFQEDIKRDIENFNKNK